MVSVFLLGNLLGLWCALEVPKRLGKRAPVCAELTGAACVLFEMDGGGDEDSC
ncbi:hypothetical protein ABH917_000863 [Thermobifida halotolerans]